MSGKERGRGTGKDIQRREREIVSQYLLILFLVHTKTFSVMEHKFIIDKQKFFSLVVLLR
jgi:hypothetical protein